VSAKDEDGSGSGQDILIEAAEHRVAHAKRGYKGRVGAGQEVGRNGFPRRPVGPSDHEVKPVGGFGLAPDLLAKVTGLGGKGGSPDRKIKTVACPRVFVENPWPTAG
jgi:hypothetical protein